MNKNIIVFVVLMIILATGGFYAGMQYQLQKRTGQFGNSTFGGRFITRSPNGQNSRSIRGQVINLSSGNLTLKLPDGTTRIVILSSSTTFVQSVKINKNDLKTGDAVSIFGVANSDGSLTAKDVLINPGRQSKSFGSEQPTATGTGY